jgi:hypothetical protein
MQMTAETVPAPSPYSAETVARPASLEPAYLQWTPIIAGALALMQQHRPKDPKISKAERALWNGINDFARELGGWTTSEPGVFPLRLECQIGSSLPEVLQELGHSVRHLGTHERLMPTTEIVAEAGSTRKVVRQQVAPGVAAVYELSLKGKARSDDAAPKTDAK